MLRRELLYKPIVLCKFYFDSQNKYLFLFDILMHSFGLQTAACGHLSCFWCVHRSMSGLRVSHCPICRDPYLHFPTICLQLHFLLKKLYPIAHNKREAQLLSEFFFALSVTFSMLLGSGVSNFCCFNVLVSR